MRWVGITFLIVTALAAIIAIFSLPPIAQPLEYHNFAGSRWANVLTSFLFFFVGLWGMAILDRKSLTFKAPIERLLWWLFFSALIGVALLSALYHMIPSNSTLAWDRFAMALAFMSLFGVLLTERFDQALGVYLSPALILLGLISVIIWMIYDDLRLYALVQFYPLIGVAILLLLFPRPYPGSYWIWIGLGLILLSKAFELNDWEVYRFTGETVAGHPLKHIFSALGAGCLPMYLKARI